MKKILIIISLISSCLFMISCKKSLLNTEPDNKYTESNFWNSEADANAGLTACYAALTDDGLYGGDATALWEDGASPNEYDYSNSMGFNVIAEGLQSASNSTIINNRWAHCYSGIGRCNTFLAKVDQIDMSEATKTRMKGEARFLRALYYFLLENYYGDVPLVLDPPNVATQVDLPRTPREQIVQQVLSDLDSAAQVLPIKKYGSADLGRVTKGAALSLKARVLLFEASPLLNTGNDINKWKEAADAAKAVMDIAAQAGYGLYPDYRALFLPENENNKEVIFDVQFIYPFEGNSFDLIDKQYNTDAPLLDLAEAYDMQNGLPITDPASGYNADSPYVNRDPRLYATIVYPGDTFMGQLVTPSRFAITGYGLKKYSVYDKGPASPDVSDLKAGQSYTNFILLRYADILLMYAEAQNEVSGPDASVYSAINMVRERAGMPDVEPAYNQSELREIIRHERRIEFAGEGLYYNDIRRWKTAETVMNATIYTYDHSTIETRKFDPNRDYWWPVPQTELDLDPKLTQNKGY